MYVDPTVANMGLFLPSFFILFFDEDATYLFLTDSPWLQPPPYGAAAATPPALTPTRDCHQNTKHLGWQGLQNCAGHPGGGTWGVRRDSSDKDEDLDGGVIP